jgi:protein-disulfide isomerase
VWLVPIGKSPVRGKNTALVTIVEFSDFQCPFCKKVEPTLEQVQKEYGDKVRIVWKNNPLPFHPRAEPAAQLAIEARAQRGDAAFFRVHDALFADQQHLDDASLEALAGAAGLDVKRAMKAVADHKHRKIIDEDQDLADDLQANGTPHFFVNGRRLVGAQPIEKFRSVIDEEIARAEALVKAGLAPAKVYDKLQANAKAPPPPERKAIPAPTKDNPSRGPAGAKVVVQVFSDFQCPFCKRVKATIEQLEQEFAGKIRIVWRNHPLPMHKDAEPAAEAAMEAFRQKGAPGFWAMHDLLFASQSQPGGLERPALEGYAAQLGLDLGRFTNALDTSAHKGLIDADSKVAADASISGTPAFVINGYFVSGAQPAAKFRKLIKRALGE